MWKVPPLKACERTSATGKVQAPTKGCGQRYPNISVYWRCVGRLSPGACLKGWVAVKFGLRHERNSLQLDIPKRAKGEPRSRKRTLRSPLEGASVGSNAP